MSTDQMEKTEIKKVLTVNHARTIFLEKTAQMVSAHVNYFLEEITRQLNESKTPIKSVSIHDVSINETMAEAIEEIKTERDFTVVISKSEHDCEETELSNITFSGWGVMPMQRGENR